MPRSLKDELSHRIQERGQIPFVEFMGLSLYWPRGGYYRGPSPTGAGGDYYTAPAVHPAFGALLCLQLFQMWRLLQEPNPFQVVEVGAGSGILSRDILAFAPTLPANFHRALRYLCLDFAPPNADDDSNTAPSIDTPGVGAIPNTIPLITDLLPLSDVVGCIISNELIDALPVHLVELRNGRLREIYVTIEAGKIVEVTDEPSTPALQQRLDDLGVKLAEGQRAEINLAMAPWLKDAAQTLQKGYLLTIDYGREANELYSPKRFRGTLTTFHRHTQTDNPYVRVGRQDMTSQVDFTTFKRIGEGLGLANQLYLPQGQFLANLGLRRWVAALPAMGLPQPRRDANRMGMLQLARPEGMGGFRALIQGKHTPDTPLWGSQPSRELAEILERLTPPMLTDRHMPLLRGHYPF